MLFGRLFVVLGLVAFSAAAAVDDNNSKQLEALMPLLAAQLGQVTGGGATPLNARYFLRGLEKLQMMQCTACAAGQVEQQPCSISADRVCGAATGAVSLTTSAGTFDAFVKVDSVGRKWVKAIQFPADYVPNTGTFGPIGKEAITEKAKLSDAQINSLSTTGTRVYRVDVDATWKESSWTNQFLYVSTDRPHVDTSASFGAVGGATRAKLGAENLDVGDVSSWSTFTQTWWDNLYSSPQIATEGCSRLFIGHGHFDCYSEGGVRCIKGGGSCKSGGYPKIPNVVIWVLYK